MYKNSFLCSCKKTIYPKFTKFSTICVSVMCVSDSSLHPIVSHMAVPLQFARTQLGIFIKSVLEIPQ